MNGRARARSQKTPSRRLRQRHAARASYDERSTSSESKSYAKRKTTKPWTNDICFNIKCALKIRFKNNFKYSNEKDIWTCICSNTFEIVKNIYFLARDNS